jgi:ATP-dependent DNA helicase RecG
VPEQMVIDFDSVSPPRPELLDLWTPDDIFAAAIRDGVTALLRFGEDSRVEWKSVKYEPKDLADYFSMWANTQPSGGLIVVGLEKTGVISGCSTAGPNRLSALERTGPDYCPDAKYEIHRIKAPTPDGRIDFLMLIRVFYHSDKLVETVGNEALSELVIARSACQEMKNARFALARVRSLTN